ncbi:MAG: Bifunctional hemolysin/adenylate cyclase precursor, partial [Planctomycetota bacterium]
EGTADSDLMAIDGPSINFDRLAIGWSALEAVTVHGRDGDDQLQLQGTVAAGSVHLLGESGDDTITLAYPVAGGDVVVDGGTGANDWLSIRLSDEAEAVTLAANSLAVSGMSTVSYADFDTLLVNTQDGADEIVVSGTHAGATELDSGDGSDTVAIDGVDGALRVATGSGGDTIHVRAANAATMIDAGDDDDFFNVGSQAPATGGRLTQIMAELAIVGGDGVDTLNVDSTGALAMSEGRLTSGGLSGLGLGADLLLNSLESLYLGFGSYPDRFTIASTADAMSVTLRAGAGDDRIVVEAINGPVTIEAEDGSDSIVVAPTADRPVDSGLAVSDNRSAINGALMVRGGHAVGDRDELLFSTTFPVTEPGRLTGDRLSGLQLPSGIEYAELEALCVVIDTVSDVVFTIESTHAGSTELATGSGADIINVRTIDGTTTIRTGGAADTFNVGSRARGVSGNASLNDGGELGGIAGRLILDGGPATSDVVPSNGGDTLNGDDSGDTLPNQGTLASTVIHGLGMAAGLFYEAIESLNITLGAGDDRLSIASTQSDTSYTMDGGGGSDTFEVGNGDLDTLAGRVRLSGGAGLDQASLDDSGTAKSVDYRVGAGLVTSPSRPGQPNRVFADIAFDANLESLALAGTSVANVFDVVPSVTTRFAIDGRSPVGGAVPPKLGDYLRVDVSGVSGESLTWTTGQSGAGIWQFASGHQPIQFASIERFNGVDALGVFSAAGLKGAGGVKVYDPKSGRLRFTIPEERLRSEGFREGLRVATGDLNGDGVPDIAVSQDFVTNSKVKVFDGIDGRQLVSLRPYDNVSFCRGVVELAIGDVNGDGWNDLVVGQNCDVSVTVRVFSGDPNANWRQLGAELRPFGAVGTRLVSLAIADQNVRGGANRGLLWANATVDNVATIRAFQWNNAAAFDEVLGSRFNPFGATSGQGIRIASGDVNGDGVEDVIASLGPGQPPTIRTFDGARYGQPIVNTFPSSNQAKAVDAVFIDAFDYNGDGVTDQIAAFDSPSGLTTEVRKFSAAGVPAGTITANQGAFPDLSGRWIVNGQVATISQTGTALTLTDETGRVTAAKLQGIGQVVTVNFRVLARIDGNVLRFANGTNWQRLDLTGTYAVDGGLARIQHEGSEIRIWDPSGKLSVASFTAARTIVVPALGNMVGQIRLGGIDWSDGAVWRKLDLSSNYKNAAGDWIRILSNGAGDVVFVTSRGHTSIGRWIDPTRLVAVEWGGMTGVVRDSRIVWSDGGIWSKVLRINGVTATRGPVAIESRGDQILLINGSSISRARLVNAQTIYAIDWRRTGTIVDDQIRWSNGTVWKDFGFEALNAAFRDIETLPFPNLLLKGDNSRGGAVTIELRQNQLFVTDSNGRVAPATRPAPGKIAVASWNLTGTLIKGKIYWSNATVWRGFDATLIDYVLNM